MCFLPRLLRSGLLPAILIPLCVVSHAAVSANDTPAASAARAEQPLMAGWSFLLGDPAGAAQPGFDDAAWAHIDLPHTWNAQDGQDGGGNYHRGAGWYRTHFRVDSSWAGRRVFLEFDGANRSAEVFLNGRRLGEHRGGYARFRFDATAALRPEGDNLLAVRVSNAADDNLIPVSADYTFFGGLYRGVRLVATSPVHIDLLDYASPGVDVRAAPVTKERADLALRVKLANDSDTARPVTTRIRILDATGAVVRELQADASLAAHARGETRLQTAIAQPHLWDAQADPYLYSVRAETLVDGAVTDAVTIPLGLRFFSVDPDRGFSLNGHYLDLHGVNRHQDRPDKGWAISEADEREDFALIEEVGATIVRQSHYQQSQLWDELGDTRGMIMWAELPFTGPVRDNPEFFANAQEQLRELIRQNRQHPSIVFWSIGNETHNPKELPPDANDRLLAALAQVVREEDDTRLSTYACDGNADDSRASHTDVIGFNYYAGWYHGTPEDFGPWIDAQHAAHRAMRIGVSEYGAGANVTQHEVPAKKPVPNGPWHPEEWQARQHEAYWQAMAARPWIWGKMIWCMFDFASDGRNEGGVPGRNDKGLVTADRQTRKDAFYWYQANWSSRPVLHLTSQRYTPRPAGATSIKVYSNAPAVELTLNGRSLGKKTSANHLFEWPEVTLAKGANRVTATAIRDGQPLEDACVWVGE